METLLMSDKIQVERKQFYFDLKENPRGRFLRITEDVAGRRDTIIIPSTGLEQFLEAIQKAIEVNHNPQLEPEEVGAAT
ncbi:MAG: PUR family DNA/RNA-binding protein [Verrucomicrobia bacterium]|nr:PUR family DNA/RNA-binding protein [Kiritimatiellia bacterium]MCP5487071.1 PUR family DNA/RNA-binding protein [Verrucomicrobiota bacterium]